jgi:hypothetical protein
MKLFQVAALTGAIALITAPLAARALDLTIPLSLLPDACISLTGCPIQFTHANLLLQIKQLLATAQNLKNIGNIATAQGAIKQVIDITNAAQAVPPLHVGDAAALQILNDVANTTNRVAHIDTYAQTANGAQQQSQVQNLYASTITGELIKANALAAEQQKQRQAEIDGAASALIEFNGSGSNKILEGGL